MARKSEVETIQTKIADLEHQRSDLIASRDALESKIAAAFEQSDQKSIDKLSSEFASLDGRLRGLAAYRSKLESDLSVALDHQIASEFKVRVDAANDAAALALKAEGDLKRLQQQVKQAEQIARDHRQASDMATRKLGGLFDRNREQVSDPAVVLDMLAYHERFELSGRLRNIYKSLLTQPSQEMIDAFTEEQPS